MMQLKSRRQVSTLGPWAVLLALTPFCNAVLEAQLTGGPIDIESRAAAIVAPTRIAWCCELSPDETWLAACYGYFQGDVGRIRIWDVKTGKVKWEAHEDRGIRHVTISPDGLLVASGNYGGQICLREAATGQVRLAIENGGASVECVSFSSDGRKLVSCGNRSELRLWDVSTGQMLKTIASKADVLYGACFSADDKQLLSYGREGSVRVWDADRGNQVRVYSHPNLVHAAIFLPGGKEIATACQDGQVRIFSLDADEAVTTLPPFSAQSAFALALAVSRDGGLLAVGDAARIRIWNTSGWKSAALLEPRNLSWGLNFNRDATKLFSAGGDSSIRSFDLASNTENQRFDVPGGEQTGAGTVRALAVSSDGKLIATAAAGRGVEIRDRASGELQKTLRTRDATSIVFSPDGQSLAAAGGGLSFWEVKTGVLRQDIASPAIAVACSSDGKLCATGGSDNVVRLWDANTKEEIASLEGHTEQVDAVAFSPDGKRLVSASQDFTARVWDIEKRVPVAMLKGHAAAINAVAYSPDGKTIATASNDGTAGLWETRNYRLRASLAHQQPVISAAFAGDSETLATGGENGALWLWSNARGSQRKRLMQHSGAVRGLAFLMDNSGLISASEDQSIRFWKATEPALLPLVTLSAHSPEALCAAFSADGKWLVTGGADKNLAIRDAATGMLRQQLHGHTSRVNRIAMSPDSKRAASVSGDGTVRLWSLQQEEEITEFNAWNEKFAAGRAIAFSSDGRTIASGADDGTIKLWDQIDRKLLHTLAEQSLPVTSLVFTNDGSTLLSATGDWRNNRVPGEIRLWEVASGRELAELKGCASEIKCIAVDKNGELLASTEAGSDLHLWNLKNHQLLRTLRLDSLSGSLAFSPDGKRLATGHYSGSIVLWDVPDLKPVQRYTGHTKGIPGIAFRPDGKLIATTGLDGKLSLWPVSAESPNE
jgi:WD40 repeat protein